MSNEYKGINGGWPTYPSVDWNGFFPKINQNYYGLSSDVPIPLNEITVKGNAPKWYRDMSNEERAFRDYVNYRNSNPEAWKEDAPTINTYTPLTYEESRSQQARQASREKHRQLASYYARQSPTLSNLLSAFDNWAQGAGIAPMDEYKPIGEPVMLLGGPQNIAQLSRTARMVREFENAANEMEKAKEASVVADKLFPIRNPQIRTRLGDVEIDNPNMFYRQGSSSMGEDFLRSGVVSSDGVQFSNPMYSEGRLWYGIPTKRMLNQSGGITAQTKNSGKISLVKRNEIAPKTDLLTSYGLDMVPATQRANRLSYYPITTRPLSLIGRQERAALGPSYKELIDEINDAFYKNQTYSGTKIGMPTYEHTRRVPKVEGGANKTNTVLYRYDPNYGYKKVTQESPSTLTWGRANTIFHNNNTSNNNIQ